jgi:hypothetical protein
LQRKKNALISSLARRSDRMPAVMARGSDVVMVTRLSRMWSRFAQQCSMDQPSSGHAGGSCCRASRCAAHDVACHRRPRCHSCEVHRLRIGGAQEAIVRFTAPVLVCGNPASKATYRSWRRWVRIACMFGRRRHAPAPGRGGAHPGRLSRWRIMPPSHHQAFPSPARWSRRSRPCRCRAGGQLH